MKNIYEIEMKLESKQNENALSAYEKLMKVQAVEYFNKEAKKARNPKRITDVVIYDNKCKIVLESEERLTSPAKSIRKYTSFLLEHGMKKLAKDNALFRSTDVSEKSKELDDESLIGIVVHSVLSNKKVHKDFILKVKELVIEMDLI